MELVKKQLGSNWNVAVVGKLDTNSAPELRREVAENLENITELTFDIAEMDYISSAGLRVLLFCQQTMNSQGKMTVINVRPEIMTIFKATGFLEILNIA